MKSTITAHNPELRNAIRWLKAIDKMKPYQEIGDALGIGKKYVSLCVTGKKEMTDGFRDGFERLFDINLDEFNKIKRLAKKEAIKQVAILSQDEVNAFLITEVKAQGMMIVKMEKQVEELLNEIKALKRK